jgi:hypothetical protein
MPFYKAADEKRWDDGRAMSIPAECECRNWAAILPRLPGHHPKCVEGLHMCRDETDTVIAFSSEDAGRVWSAHNGSDYEEEFAMPPEEAWYQVQDDAVEGLCFPDEPERKSEEHTASEWVRLHGRCWHGSTEY